MARCSRPTLSPDILDVLAVIVEDEEEGTERAILVDEAANPVSELVLVHTDALAEVIILHPHVSRPHRRKTLESITYIAVVRHVVLRVLAAFVDDEMAMLLHRLLVDPLDEAPPELRQERMVPIPRLEVHRAPRPEPRGPERAHALEQQPS